MVLSIFLLWLSLTLPLLPSPEALLLEGASSLLHLMPNFSVSCGSKEWCYCLPGCSWRWQGLSITVLSTGWCRWNPTVHVATEWLHLCCSLCYELYARGEANKWINHWHCNTADNWKHDINTKGWIYASQQCLMWATETLPHRTSGPWGPDLRQCWRSKARMWCCTAKITAVQNLFSSRSGETMLKCSHWQTWN